MTRPSATQSSMILTIQSTSATIASSSQSATRPSVRQSSSGYVDTRKTSYLDVKTSELYDTIGDTDISVYVGIITEELSETICETECIDYLDAPKASNANTETSEFDKTIGKTEETSYNMFDDIVFGRTRAMWWSADHHIERGCESTSSLLHPWIRDIHDGTPSWLKVLHCQKKGSSTANVPQPSTTIAITAIDV